MRQWQLGLVVVGFTTVMVVGYRTEPEPEDPLPFVYQTAAEMLPSYVAGVLMYDDDGHPQGAANAFVVDARQGILMTNAHVVASQRNFRVWLQGAWFSADVVVPVDWLHDLALLKLRSHRGIPVAMAPIGVLPTQGDVVTVYSQMASKEEGAIVLSPRVSYGLVLDSRFAMEPMLTSGELAQTVLSILFPHPCSLTDLRSLPLIYGDFVPVILTDMNPEHRGQSGSPVVDSQGFVVGVFAMTGAPHDPMLQNVALIIPTRQGSALLDHWHSHAEIRTPCS